MRVGAYYGGIDSGRAAESGILAAMLADHGLPGITEDSLEGKFGFLNTYAGEGNFQRKSIVDSLGQKWSMSDVFLKRYPISYACHQVVDAAIRLHSKVGYSEIARVRYGDKLENIRLFAEPSSSKKRPANMYDAKTSTYFLIALALAYGDVTSKFLSDKVREKKILQLFDKVQYEPDEMDVWVEADKKNGTPHKEVVSSLIQTDDKKLRKKYYENAEPSIGRKNAEKVEELIRDLERVKSIRSLTKLLLSPKL